MVVVSGTLLALALLAAGTSGAAAGSILSSGGGTKKQQTSSVYSPQITHPFAQYSPVYAPQETITSQFDYVHAPSVIISSPSALGAQVETKKEAKTNATQETSPEITPSITSAPSTSQSQTDWGTMGTIALIGVIALGGIYLLRRSKK